MPPLTVFVMLCQFVLGMLALMFRTHPESADKLRPLIFWGYIAVSAIAIGVGWWAASNQKHVLSRIAENVTGGESYPIVTPTGDGDVSQLLIWNKGDSALTGVRVHLVCVGMPTSERTIEVGTVPPHSPEPIDAPLDHKACLNAAQSLPNHSGELIAVWWVDIVAQNGNYVEVIMWRKRGDCPHWSRRWFVSLQPKGDYEHPNVARGRPLEGFPPDFARDRWFDSPECNR
jgi:hypothetical protein